MNHATAALNKVRVDTLGGIIADQGRELTIDLKGKSRMRVQAALSDTLTWGATVIALQYRLAPNLPWIELDTTQRISAAGLFPATGAPYDVTGLAEARMSIVTAGSAGTHLDLAMFAESGD